MTSWAERLAIGVLTASTSVLPTECMEQPLAIEFCEFLLAVPESDRHGRVFRPMSRNGSDARMGNAWVGKIICRTGEVAKVKVAEGKRKGKPHTKYASAHDLRRCLLPDGYRR